MIPKPVQFERMEGNATFDRTQPLTLHCVQQELLPAADFFQRTVKSLIPDIAVRIVSSTQAGKSPVIQLNLTNDTGRAEESYTLSIEPDHIQLDAPDYQGIMHGIASLLQLIANAETSGTEITIPCCHMEDAPALKWRGMHLDVSRHFFPVEVVERFLDILTLYKINIFHWHLTDDQGWRIQIDAYPKLTEVGAYRIEADGIRCGGYYTKDDIRRVVKYAEKLGITIVPEIELPGHASAVLAAYPELSCHGQTVEVPTTWGIFNDVLCPSNPETLTFLETVLNEVTALFPGPWVHIGGDECPSEQWQTCDRCKALAQKENLPGIDYLQGWLNRWVGDLLKRKGKTLVGWDEILDRDAPEGAIVMAWRGVDHGLNAVKQGHHVVMSPVSHCYFDYAQAESGEPEAFDAVLTLENVMSFNPVPEGIDPSERSKVLGGQANVWTERISTENHLHYMLLPRLCALSETLWGGHQIEDPTAFFQRLQTNVRMLAGLGIHFRPVSPIW